MSTKKEEFAFGRSEVNSCKCPAVTAGYTVIGNRIINQVAAEFDQRARSELSETGQTHDRPPQEGKLEESKAQEVWAEVVDYFVDMADSADSKANEHQYSLVAQAARQIAYDLGWEEVAYR